MNRLRENIEAAEITLTAEESDQLDKTFPEGAFAGTRYASPQMGMVVN
jgi:aryl-alcohol dehydrogenase-like predicted oxidoreductase